MLPSSLLLATANLLSVHLPILDVHRKESHSMWPFVMGVFSLGITQSRFTHVVACVHASFLFKSESCPITWVMGIGYPPVCLMDIWGVLYMYVFIPPTSYVSIDQQVSGTESYRNEGLAVHCPPSKQPLGAPLWVPFVSPIQNSPIAISCF